METKQESLVYARNVALAGIAELAGGLHLLVRLAILTRLLGPSEYGVWAILWATVMLVTPVAVMGLAMTMIRFLAAETDRDKIGSGFFSILFAVLASSLVVGLVMILISGPLALSLSGDSDYSILFKLGLLMIAGQALSRVVITFFRTFRRMKLYVAAKLVQPVVEAGLLVAVLLGGLGIRGALFSVVIADLAMVSFAMFFVLRQVGFHWPRWNLLKPYLKYGIPLIPNVAMLWIANAGDRYMLGWLAGIEAVGIYGAAYELSRSIVLLTGAVGVVLFPTIVRFHELGNVSATKSYLQYSIKYVMTLAIPAATGMSVLAVPLLRLISTEDFVAGRSIVCYVSAGMVLLAFYQMCVFVIHLSKKTYWTTLLLGISAGSNIVMNLLLIPPLGIEGAAIATLISYGILGALTFCKARQYLAFDLQPVFLLKSLFSSAIMAVCLLLINPVGLGALAFSIVTGIVVYFVVLFTLRGLDRREWRMLVRFVASGRTTGSAKRL